jgi:hypothetical protein
MKGWVYIITTKSMPDLVKVGFSTKDPDLRAAELNNTGNPHPYKVEYEVLVNEPRNVEQIAHRLLKNKDLHENKEWFNCSIELAVVAIREAADGGIFLENLRSKIFSEPEIEITSEETENTPFESVDDAWLDELITWADFNKIPKEQLPRDKQEILALTTLSLGWNKLTKIPDSIGNLTNLQELNLYGNQLTEIPESIGNLTNLMTLYVWHNKLIKLPKSIGNLTNLTVLNFGGNQLTEIPESIGKLMNLTYLILSGNQIKSLPSELSHLNSITRFY